MLNTCIKYLSSLRFTILLISLLGLIFAIGLWIPQQRLLKTIYLQWQKKSPELVAFLDTLGLTTIYTSPLTMSLWFLFFLNLTLVLWQRWPLVKNRIALSDKSIEDPETVKGYSFKGSFPLAHGLDGTTVIGLLQKKGFTVLGNENGFYGIKNRRAPLAFMLFHLSFFLILLGGVISIYTEFSGFIDLAQGESFQGELHRYNTSPPPVLPAAGSPPDVGFTVKSIVPRVVHDTPTGISIILADRNGKLNEVDFNRPYATEHTSFVFKHLGVSPLFVLRDVSGKEVAGAYFKLDVLQRKSDRFILGDFIITATFYPDFVLEEGKRATKSMEFNNPVFFISAERDGKKIAEGLIKENGSIEIAGYRLEMKDMPFWVRFYVVKQRGLSILYAGFALATIGVIWRLLFYRRELAGAVRLVDGARCLVIAGRSEYYKSLAEDEFNKLLCEITSDPNKSN